MEEISKSIELIDAQIAVLEKENGFTDDASKVRLEAKKSGLIEQLKDAEERREAADLAEQTSTGK